MREKKLDPTYSLKPLCNVLKAYKTFFQVLQKDLKIWPWTFYHEEHSWREFILQHRFHATISCYCSLPIPLKTSENQGFSDAFRGYRKWPVANNLQKNINSSKSKMYCQDVSQPIWDKVFKNGPSKICGRQPLKNWRGMVCFKQTIPLQIF